MTTTLETIAELKRLLAEHKASAEQSNFTACGCGFCRPLPSLLADLEAAQRRLDHEAVMATRYANEAGALEGQLDDARKREQVLRDELTRLRDVVSAVEYDSIDAALDDAEVKPCDSKLNAAARNALPSLLDDIELLRDALQAISQRHPGYGGSGEIARKALAATEVKP
jgi:hypothetical protein